MNIRTNADPQGKSFESISGLFNQ